MLLTLPSLTELERTGFFLAFLLKNPNFLCSLGDVTGETSWGGDLGDPPRLLGSGLLSLPVERGGGARMEEKKRFWEDHGVPREEGEERGGGEKCIQVKGIGVEK